MARGPSGRLVIELSPRLKRKFLERIDFDRTTVKAWTLRRIDAYLASESTQVIGPAKKKEAL